MERRFTLPARVEKGFCAPSGVGMGMNAGAADVEEVTCSLQREAVAPPAFNSFSQSSSLWPEARVGTCHLNIQFPLSPSFVYYWRLSHAIPKSSVTYPGDIW